MTKATSKLPVKPGAVLGILKELRAGAQRDEPLVVARRPGARRRASSRARTRRGRLGGTRAGAARRSRLRSSTCSPGAHRRGRRTAAQGRVACADPDRGRRRRPDGDRPRARTCSTRNVVRVGSGVGFPVDEIARRLAAFPRRVGDAARGASARSAASRVRRADPQVLAHRTASSARRSSFRGADLPVLTLNQVRLVLRIADAYGFEIDRERLPEVLGVIGSGLGFRAIARTVDRSSCRSSAGRSRERSPTRPPVRSARRPCATSSGAPRLRGSRARGRSSPGRRDRVRPTRSLASRASATRRCSGGE